MLIVELNFRYKSLNCVTLSPWNIKSWDSGNEESWEIEILIEGDFLSSPSAHREVRAEDARELS